MVFTVLDTYSHVMDDSRHALMKRIEEDFYNSSPSDDNSELPKNMEDLLALIKSNPEMQQQLLAALANGNNAGMYQALTS